MPEVLASTFVLAVRDLSASKRFYLEKLGFAEDFSVDGWAFLSRGACKLRLGHCPPLSLMVASPTLKLVTTKTVRSFSFTSAIVISLGFASYS